MTTDEQLALYGRLSEGLSRRPRESLNTAAARALSHGPPTVRKAASVVLRPSAEGPWERLARAAQVLDG
jgi:hypothetical protein